jgi:hypothetical protein
MRNTNTTGPKSLRTQIAELRSIVQRFARAEHPSEFAIIKQLLLECIAELEEEAKHTLPVAS